MSWAIGYSERWKRDVGYGVPATCDHPGCTAEIDRGLGHICGGEPDGGTHGCGLFFCAEHRQFSTSRRGNAELCIACLYMHRDPFKPTPDVDEWLRWKLTNPSWAPWRAEHPDEVTQMRERIALSESN
ncbi:hypothetical protein [Xanthomonas arboricola]|uniref:hypothetical protein n=1 Tax=Xanthomonas arboricola TaxID=56448 RepID=UPI004040B8A1